MTSERVEQTVNLEMDTRGVVRGLSSKAGMTVTAAYRELLDNALDAKAKHVEFECSSRARTLTIADNGKGTMNVQAIVTPYKHEAYEGQESGRYGIGGTLSQIWLTQGQGRSEVESTTRMFRSTIIADFGEWDRSGKLQGSYTHEPNVTGHTGTIIKLTGCMEITSDHLGPANRHLSFDFTPALRRGVEIVLTLNGKSTSLKPYERPPYLEKLSFNFEVDGHPIKGICCITKPGETNQARGWAVAKAHRFIGVFKQPAGTRSLDFGRLYAEVYLPKEWTNITDHKDGFVTEPVELWEKLAEACAPILDRIEHEARVIELETSRKTAQELLDMATGYAGEGIRGLRGGPPKTQGTAEPTNNGTTHKRFSKHQPGNKSVPSRWRIQLDFCSGMDRIYEVSPESRLIRVSLNEDAPAHENYRRSDAGEFLAHYVLLQVAGDAHARPAKYKAIFPVDLATSIPEIFEEMLSRIGSRNSTLV